MSKPASEGSSSPSSTSDARAVLDINGHDATGAGGGGVLKTGAADGVTKPPERWDGASWLQQVCVIAVVQCLYAGVVMLHGVCCWVQWPKDCCWVQWPNE